MKTSYAPASALPFIGITRGNLFFSPEQKCIHGNTFVGNCRCCLTFCFQVLLEVPVSKWARLQRNCFVYTFLADKMREINTFQVQQKKKCKMQHMSFLVECCAVLNRFSLLSCARLVMPIFMQMFSASASFIHVNEWGLRGIHASWYSLVRLLSLKRFKCFISFTRFRTSFPPTSHWYHFPLYQLKNSSSMINESVFSPIKIELFGDLSLAHGNHLQLYSNCSVIGW